MLTVLVPPYAINKHLFGKGDELARLDGELPLTCRNAPEGPAIAVLALGLTAPRAVQFVGVASAFFTKAGEKGLKGISGSPCAASSRAYSPGARRA